MQALTMHSKEQIEQKLDSLYKKKNDLYKELDELHETIFEQINPSDEELHQTMDLHYQHINKAKKLVK